MSTAFRQPRPDECEPGEAPSDPQNVARILVLRRLDTAPRTRVELERFLAQRGIPEDVATAVGEGASAAELRGLCDALMRAADAADGWR